MNPADAQERAIALDIHRSFIVEAPAGSGKTALLISRFMKLLLDHEVKDPAEVLAITFTVKATEEIRARVLDALTRAGQGQSPTNDFEAQLFRLASDVLRKDSELSWQLLEQPERLNIRTIDGLAAHIARSLPVLGGGLGILEPVEDAQPLFAMAARRVIHSLGSDDDPELLQALRSLLLHRDVNLASVESELADMLATREQWAPFIPHAGGGEAALERVRQQMDSVLEYEVCRRLTALAAAIPDDAKYRLSVLVNQLCDYPGSNQKTNTLSIHCAGMDSLPGSGCADLDTWKQIVSVLLTNSETVRKSFTPQHFPIEVPPELQRELKDFFATIDSPELTQAAIAVKNAPPFPYPDDQWRLVVPLFRLLRHALAQLQIVFAEERKCDFTEISLAAIQALQTPDGAHDLAATLGTKLRHLLMDEMQDTSQRQYDLLELLTAGWDGHNQTVFLVGDPKQSIYIFRQARPELFLRALKTQRIGDVPLSRLTLTANFRSEERLVHRFNELFGAIFTPTRGDRIEYTPAVAMSPTQEGDLHWRLGRQAYISAKATYSDKAAARQRRTEFQTSGILETVQHWIAQPHPSKRPWKIAILVRGRNHAAPIIAALRHRGIATRSLEIDELSSRPEVMDLLALTRTLIHLADRTAWLAVLHAPWCGLNVTELHTIAGGDMPSLRNRALLPILEERVDLLDPPAALRARRTLDVLKESLRKRGQMSFARWVEVTWRSLGGDASLTADETSNALEYFAMLDALAANGHEPSLAELDRALTRLFATSTSAEASVEVLTIHKSKGLEWDLVFVPSLERRGASDKPKLLDWADVNDDQGDRIGILLAPIQSKGEEGTNLHRAISAIRQRRIEAELDRLFYVATTRARSAVHLFAALNSKASEKPTKKNPDPPEGDVTCPANSLLRCAWETVGPMFDTSAVVRLDHAAVTPSDVSARPESDEDVLQLAASAATPQPSVTFHLPDSFDPRARFQNSLHRVQTPPSPLADGPQFHRPTGSLAARALGDTAHVFLQQLADRIASGSSIDHLLQEIETWSQRISAVVRSNGIGTREAAHVASRVMEVLTSTLQSKTGAWILAAHAEAESERPLLVRSPDRRVSFERVDRTFLAGPDLLSTGNSTRWIIDFKTAHRHSGIDQFLKEEQAVYAPKMEAYARAAQSAYSHSTPIQLALFYPLLDRSIHWQAQGTD